jgi:8-oxo-dGTP diphosphatase
VLTLDIFIHLDAVDRRQWDGAPDDRPLSELGRRQGERLAEELGATAISALVSSPALRCRASLEALAARTRLPIEVAPGFKDTGGYQAPAGWGNAERPGPDPLGGAQAAGSAFAALTDLRARFPDGRVILCSYGDIVPALLAFLSGAHGIDMPARNNRKGVIFTVRTDGRSTALETRDAPGDFPQ